MPAFFAIQKNVTFFYAFVTICNFFCFSQNIYHFLTKAALVRKRLYAKFEKRGKAVVQNEQKTVSKKFDKLNFCQYNVTRCTKGNRGLPPKWDSPKNY
ncbi:MAG: hypothetical protein J6B52_00210 [Clostridia bacterium]|nr:hypothetical protein [Clostridia bacterium]